MSHPPSRTLPHSLQQQAPLLPQLSQTTPQLISPLGRHGAHAAQQEIVRKCCVALQQWRVHFGEVIALALARFLKPAVPDIGDGSSLGGSSYVVACHVD